MPTPKLILLLLLCSGSMLAQVKESKNWCLSKCDLAGDEKENTSLLHQSMEKMENKEEMMAEKTIFPLRIGVAQKQIENLDIDLQSIVKTIDYLNLAFAESNIVFTIGRVETIQSAKTIRDLSENYYASYLAFSSAHDLKDTISLYLFDYDPNLCLEVEGGGVSCGRTGGFSYILSELTNNVVLSKFDLEDHKVVAHEFGHFFGLYHTFESAQFGKDEVNGENCNNTGDMICDTPADPGPIFEVYVNYSKCEMLNYSAAENEYYTPLINNFMSYYKPCYLKPYAFTKGQLEVMKMAAHSNIRKGFAQ